MAKITINAALHMVQPDVANVYEKIVGEEINLDCGVPFVISKQKGKWWIFEKSTGINIVHEATTKKSAINHAKSSIERNGVKRLIQAVNSFEKVN
jgi:hypothetical protein